MLGVRLPIDWFWCIDEGMLMAMANRNFFGTGKCIYYTRTVERMNKSVAVEITRDIWQSSPPVDGGAHGGGRPNSGSSIDWCPQFPL
jgi:hypothetical protein